MCWSQNSKDKILILLWKTMNWTFSPFFCSCCEFQHFLFSDAISNTCNKIENVHYFYFARSWHPFVPFISVISAETDFIEALKQNDISKLRERNESSSVSKVSLFLRKKYPHHTGITIAYFHYFFVKRKHSRHQASGRRNLTYQELNSKTNICWTRW